MYAQDNLIFGFQFYLCTLITIPFTIPYRVGQFLTLIIALDRFMAVWKPFMYNKNQSFNNVIINGIASSGLSFLLVLILFMNMDVKSLVTLDKCTSPRSDLWYQVIPSYSGIVSILFFGLYLSSLLRLYRHLTLTKRQQVHAQDSITRIQKNIYITVSYALFCYSIFYGIPTILQMLSYYCKISGWVNDFSSYFIIYGGQFNGILNAVIYIFKHQEFNKCSKQLICKIRGKIRPTSDNYNNNTSKDVFKHVNNTEKF